MKTKKNLSILSLTLSYGGAERVISLLLKHLVNDYNVTLVLFHDIRDFDIPEEVEVKVLFSGGVENIGVFLKLKEALLAAKKYSSFIKKNKIDISMSFLALPNIVNGIVRKKNKNLRTVISERCFPSKMYKAHKSSELISKYVIPKYYSKNDALFSNSIYINKDLEENFNVKIPMSVIYNPIVIDENLKILPITIEPKAVLNFICVGAVYEAKNQPMIVKAMSHLNKGDYHYTQAGAGALENELKVYTNKLGLKDNVTFLGNITNVKENLLKNDCFVLSSNTEGFPNVVLEALASGLPVISTNCMSGPLELLNDNDPVKIEYGDFAKCKYGILINVNDDKGLAKALTYLKENHEVRQHYSKVGFERAKQNNLLNIYNQVKELLNG